MTPRQEAFCHEYLIDLNATQAAIRAGYSPNSANEQAVRIMDEPEVQMRISQLMEERMKRVGVTSEFVLQELLALARTTGSNSVKVRALELLGKHLKLFTEKLDIDMELALKAEEYSKLPVDKQIELMKAEIAKLEARKNETP